MFIQIFSPKPSKSKPEGGFYNKRSRLVGKLESPGFFGKIKHSFQTNNKFTIHPFRSLHSRHLLPLPLNSWAARFGLEMVIIIVAAFSVMANVTLKARANFAENQDRSVIFSYLTSNPKLNSPLVSATQTTTITAQADRWISKASASSNSSVVLASASNQSTADTNTSTTIQDNVIVKTNPANTDTLRHSKTMYEVKSGDNLISIASSYGISTATIIKENNLDVSGMIKPGQDLTILPVDGISYTLKSGDTLEAIANKYKIALDDLLDINDLELESDAQIGDSIVIPTKVTLPAPTAPKKFVTTNSGQVKLTQATAPSDLAASALSFIWPTATHSITQGYSSRHSGVDISDSKMEPIYAAESGFVEVSGFQSNGYGNTIVINHGSGFKTRYGHASELYVKAGEYVVKGQTIAKQGRTGRVRGVTGIHLHFEITKNAKHVNPLSYVKP